MKKPGRRKKEQRLNVIERRGALEEEKRAEDGGKKGKKKGGKGSTYSSRGKEMLGLRGGGDVNPYEEGSGQYGQRRKLGRGGGRPFYIKLEEMNLSPKESSEKNRQPAISFTQKRKRSEALGGKDSIKEKLKETEPRIVE